MQAPYSERHADSRASVPGVAASAALMRAPAAMLLALIVTCSLFLLMKSLIATTHIAIDTRPGTIVNIVKPRKMEPIRTIKPALLKPPPPDELPPAPRIRIPISRTAPGIGQIRPLLNPVAGKDIAPTIGDGAYLPIVRVAPVYPQRALARGIEGYTIVQFDVSADGSVTHPVVVEHFPSRVFDAASLAAVKRFRFKPQIRNGRPVIVTGIRNRFTFELSQDRL